MQWLDVLTRPAEALDAFVLNFVLNFVRSSACETEFRTKFRVRFGKPCESEGESPSSLAKAGIRSENEEWKSLTNSPRPRVARPKESR